MREYAALKSHGSGLRQLIIAKYVFFVVTIRIRACLHEGGGPQVGEVTCGGLPHLTCKRDHSKMRDYMDRRVTPPKRVTSPIWGTLPPCKQTLNVKIHQKQNVVGPKHLMQIR